VANDVFAGIEIVYTSPDGDVWPVAPDPETPDGSAGLMPQLVIFELGVDAAVMVMVCADVVSMTPVWDALPSTGLAEAPIVKLLVAFGVITDPISRVYVPAKSAYCAILNVAVVVVYEDRVSPVVSVLDVTVVRGRSDEKLATIVFAVAVSISYVVPEAFGVHVDGAVMVGGRPHWIENVRVIVRLTPFVADTVIESAGVTTVFWGIVNVYVSPDRVAVML
jgi:hypothetical protein